MNTSAQDNTQHASTHLKSMLSSPQPRILTLQQVDAILRQSQEKVNHSLTKQLRKHIGQIPIEYFVPGTSSSGESLKPISTFYRPF
jgi:hypothetical protein